MDLHINQTAEKTGRAAAESASEIIKKAIREHNETNIILATGNSQLQMLDHLVKIPAISWHQVSMFHLDEYLGMNEKHPASFRRYLREHFVEKVSPLKEVFFIQADSPDSNQECKRLSDLIERRRIDLALIGIGENGHLAFNDPPADFETTEPFIIVRLDEACRKQQLGEGWFSTMEDVPGKAITMSIYQIMQSENLIVTVPDLRKAQAVRDAVNGPITNLCPASILRNHPHCSVYLDRDSASLL